MLTEICPELSKSKPGEINSKMPEWVVERTSDALNQSGKPVKGSRILILGIAYKKNIDDMRESPAAMIMKLLMEKGADIHYSDPHVPIFPRMREYHFELQSLELLPDVIASFDCVVLVADHDAFDYELIRKNASLVVDTRGVYREPSSKVVKA